jgi:hypothetical protein
MKVMMMAENEEHTIDDAAANAYFEFMNPEEQEKHRQKSYTWHHESTKSVHGFIDQLLSEKKIEIGKISDEQAVDIVAHYLIDYIHKTSPNSRLKDLFGKHGGKMTAEEKMSKLRLLGFTYLGMSPGKNGATVLDKMLSDLKEAKSLDELKNNIFETGREYFWKQAGLVNYEASRRYEKAFKDMEFGDMGKYILKHKMFEPYEQIEGKEHLIEMLHPQEEAARILLSSLGQAYHTKSVLSDKDLVPFGLKRRGVTYKSRAGEEEQARH